MRQDISLGFSGSQFKRKQAMSKIPLNEDTPEEIELDAEAMTAFNEGFLHLDTPIAAAQIENIVKQELTSGADFDPLYRQIGRRVVWTVVPAIAAFLVATCVLAVRPVPRVPLTHWL